MVPIIGINEAWSRQVQAQSRERERAQRWLARCLNLDQVRAEGNSFLGNAARLSCHIAFADLHVHASLAVNLSRSTYVVPLASTDVYD